MKCGLAQTRRYWEVGLSYLENLKRQKLELKLELAKLRSTQEILSDVISAQGYKSGAIGTYPSRLHYIKKKCDHLVNNFPPNLRDEFVNLRQVGDQYHAISTEIESEEKKMRNASEDAHKKRREIMQDRHKQIMQLLDKMDQTKLAQGTSAVQIEQERTRRADISRQIQSLINDNDAQDRADLDGLLNELRTMATHGLP